MSRKKRGSASVESRADRVIVFIERYLVVPDGAHVGRPVVLRPWQRDIIRQIYDGHTRRAIISLARKNGKTALVAMLVLAHLVGPEARRNAQIYSAAQSRDQAALVFGLAAKMVRMSSTLNNMVKPRDSAKELFCPSTGVRYKALSADAPTAYGLSPVMAIHDELGQVQGDRSELYDAIESAMGAHEAPLSIVISTQAPTDADLLSKLIDDAKKENDPRIKLFLFAADAEDDPWDVETWRKANPALGDFRSMADMQELADGARRLPASEAAFRNLNLNQRISSESHILSPTIWALNDGEPDLSVFDHGEVFVGVDLSATQDLTAIVAVAKDEDGIWHIRPWFFLPEVGLRERAQRDRVTYDVWHNDGLINLTPGRSVDYDSVAAIMVPILSGMNVCAVAYDRWQFEHLKKAFARLDYEPPFLTDFGQGVKTMTPALRTFEVLALQGRLRHGNNPVLTMCVANARAKAGDAGERKLTKALSTGRIDGAVALVMALAAADADAEPNEPSVYELLGARDAVGALKTAGSVYDAMPPDEIDYAALNDLKHPLHAEMRARFERKQAMEADAY